MRQATIGYLSLTITALIFCSCNKVKVEVTTETPQTLYAAKLLENTEGYYIIRIGITEGMPAEGFSICREGRTITIIGNDGPGTIYGANHLLDVVNTFGTLDSVRNMSDAPEMMMRGACVGLQKTTYLPGRHVYEYPYTPESFPWFYDRDLWIRYLDLLASNNMNSVYLWNGHPFASLVKLDDYPFAAEVDSATMALNQEMFDFLTTEADRRGIRVIQMFYNIIVSKPFAEHYGIKTQDRNRPITPLVADYTRKSIAAFVEKYPSVGFLICLGEAMATIEDDVTWMKETIIPGIRDGLRASGRSDTPPIILRSHDTNAPRVLEEALPHYPNIYTMSKYTGESLTTYEPGGPWGETHRRLSAAAALHIDNVHILANLEPWRWASPAFVRKTVLAMHEVHHSQGIHIYPQASYWDWPYTADSTVQGRLYQTDRDWMWYAIWGRYAWHADREADNIYWQKRIAAYYGTDTATAALIIEALDESGEIAPKLLRRFGITEGNRQTLLLGMKMSQLVNPYKYTIYPGFYESCGPQGEKLIEYAEREAKGEKHIGELPLDITVQCVAHGTKSVSAIEQASNHIKRNREEFERLANDIRCYSDYANAFRYKVDAALEILRYKWTNSTSHLHSALPLLEKSDSCWRELVEKTRSTYRYANSMQTSQRRIPVGGNEGRYKTWHEMQKVYDAERENLRSNLYKLEHPHSGSDTGSQNPQAADAQIKVYSHRSKKIAPDALLYEAPRCEKIDSAAPELMGLHALVLNRDSARIKGVTVSFECDEPVQMLVGFFQDDDPKWAKPPKLEVDAAGNEYGQAEPLITNAVNMTSMPLVNIHAYQFKAGQHTVSLPRGILMVAGFTTTKLQPRDAGLNGAHDEVDWLFN